MEAVKSSRFTLISEFIFLQIYLSKPFGILRVWFICIAGLFMFVHKDTWISPFTAAVGKVLPDGERNDYGGERRVALGWSLGALTTPARRVLTNQRRDFEKKEKRARALAVCFRWARPLWEARGQRSGRRSTLQEIAQKILKKGFIQVCTAWQNECNHLYPHTS